MKEKRGTGVEARSELEQEKKVKQKEQWKVFLEATRLKFPFSLLPT